MKRHAIALALLASFIAAAEANVPTTVTFTARLVDDKTNEALTGSHTAVFALFDGELAGTSVWTETHDVLPEDGMVYVDLGSTTPLDGKVFDGKRLWLQVSLDGTIMEPRIPLASVPYSVRASSSAKADDADKIGGLGVESLQPKITGMCNTGQYLKGIKADGSVDCADDVAGVGDITAVTAGTGLAGGAMTGAATLSLIQCGMNQILKSNGAVWQCGTDDNSGDITSVTAGPGLVGGGTTGDVSLSLPTACASGQLLKWNGSSWGCAADIDTNSGGTITGVTVTSGLMGGGSTGSVSVSLTNTCASGQTLKWSGTVWSCSNDLDTNSGGTITGVTAGAGLSGGGTSGSVTMNIGAGAGIIVQADTIGLDSVFTDQRYLSLSGGIVTGPINMSGQLLSNRGCPAGYISVGGNLCVENQDACCFTFSAAANRCRAGGAHLCTSAEVRAAMLSGIGVGNGFGLDWMADQDADDSALYVNNSGDSANPEGARLTSSSSWARCCVEIE